MKATFTKKDNRSGKNLCRDKEQVNIIQVVASYKGKLYNPVKAIFWMSRSKDASVVHCSIWVHSRHKEIDVSGYGKAGGYGYHKESEALSDAIISAGIKLDKNIGGVGDNAMESAVEAISRAAGFTGQILTV